VLRRLAAGHVIAVFWLLAGVAFYLACACIGLPHVAALVAGGLLVFRPRSRAIHLLSFAASAYLVIVVLGGVVRETSPASASTLTMALAALALTAIIAGLSLAATHHSQ